MAALDHQTLLTQAREMARNWDDLAHEVAWAHHMLVKGRMTEEAVRETLILVAPNDLFGELFKSLLVESTAVIDDLDEMILAAEEIAGAMERLAPWNGE